MLYKGIVYDVGTLFAENRSTRDEFGLDMASYGLVKVLPDGEKGATYKDIPWEPKKAFRIVAEQYNA